MLLESYLRNCHVHDVDDHHHTDDEDDDGICDDSSTDDNHDDDDNDDDDNDDDDDDDNCDDNYDGPHRKQKRHLDVPVTLALAKLYFKGNEKQNALELCMQILDQIRASARTHDDSVPTTSDMVHTSSIDMDDAADAYHLAGWVYIHSDDHTSAYRIWDEGARRIPSCRALTAQSEKRLCWDSQNSREIDTISESTEPRVFSSQDFSYASVPPALISTCPAVALFDPTTQQNRLVVWTTTTTTSPILSSLECTRVLQHVHDHHAHQCHGIWSTVRHSSVPTTDVAVQDIPSLRPWLRNMLHYRLYPMLCAAFPKLRNCQPRGGSSSSTTASSTSSSTCLTVDRLRVHDAFIVRYDAEHDMSVSLPEHSDTSLISFTVALNQRGRDFQGGGTWFECISSNSENNNENCTRIGQHEEEKHDPSNGGGGCVVDADEGHAVAFAGPLRHAGYPITSGCRIILVLFLYAQDYAYGQYLSDYIEEQKKHQEDAKDNVDSKTDTVEESDGGTDCDPENRKTSTTRPSGDSPGGFVVYNQTVELVNMLNRQVASVLDE